MPAVSEVSGFQMLKISLFLKPWFGVPGLEVCGRVSPIFYFYEHHRSDCYLPGS